MNAREIAFDILYKVEDEKRYVSEVLGDVLRIHQFDDKRERAFLTRLVEGVTERKLSLDHLIIKFSQKGKNKKIKKEILIILRMGIYQIHYMDSIPNRAVVSEMVELAKMKGFSGLSGFVNGILRNISRASEEGKLDSYLMSSLETRYSTPQWICSLLVSAYGKENAGKILEDQFQEHDTVIRINTMKTSREEYKVRLEEKGINVLPGVLTDRCLRIQGYDMVTRLPGYKDGLFTVQDETSVYTVSHAGIKPGDRVLDLCSAPGGKSMLAYELSEGSVVVSRDISEKKTALIAENAERLGFPFYISDNNKIQQDSPEHRLGTEYRPGINIEIKDASLIDEALRVLPEPERFDVVLADVPCSGLGIIGRKNDIKYHVTPDTVKELSQQGLIILKNASLYVKSSGRICYSTCTINPSENRQVVEAFLESEEGADFTLVEDRTFLQGIDGSDGFYYAVLAKRSK